MSYNYDINPWDDNYDPNAVQQSAQQSSYGGFTEGYSNPAADYSGGGAGYNNDYSYQDETQQQQQQQRPVDTSGGGGGGANNKDAEHSALGRFIRQRVPMCGPILDTLSSINLPFIDALVQHINRDLLVSKMFYFFFYSAFGSLFPLMGVYFKQQGMNPAQVGILTGVRPFIEIFSAPFWNSLAERFQKSKALLLFSLLSWIVFTYSLAHIRPPASACVAFNDTDYVLYTPYSANDLSNYEVAESASSESTRSEAESAANNEMFLNRLPSSLKEGVANADEKEGKDQILASEENQNDQRRRRRRRKRRDIGSINYGSTGKNRFAYSVDSEPGRQISDSSAFAASHLDLDVDLENDFDDKLIGNELGSLSMHESDHQQSAMSEGDELDQQQQRQQMYSYYRSRRSVNVKDIDDVLGESDEGESDSSEEQNADESDDQKPSREAESRESDESETDEEGSEPAAAGGSKQSSDRERDNNSGNSKHSKATKAAISGGGSMAAATSQATPLQAPASNGADQPLLTERNGLGGVNKTKRIYKQRHKTPPTHIVGMSPITVAYAVNYNKEKHGQFVTPMFSTIVYKLDDIKEVFFLLLLLISLGEFFSAPALTLADSATLSYLGDNIDLYGRQRMFGSFSWAITLLLVGMALDNATSIADHPCGPHQRERSYTVCFVIFSLLMACAFLTATQFKFNYMKGSKSNGGQTLVVASTNADSSSNTVVTSTFDGSAGGGDIDQLYASTQPRSIFNTAPPVNQPPPNVQQDSSKEKFEFLDKWRSAVFAQRTRELPKWVNVFRQFSNPLHLAYLFITWFLGCGVGLVFTFLFWHLQDVGGTPTLFGICSVINHISEILAYFFSFSFIKRFGHTRVSSCGCSSAVVKVVLVEDMGDDSEGVVGYF